MADGREIIEEIITLLNEISEKKEGVKDKYSAQDLEDLEASLASAQKWAAFCRRKVWLRGKEGTDMAQGCLDATKELAEVLDMPAKALEAAANAAYLLESLARVVATKSQVMT